MEPGPITQRSEDQNLVLLNMFFVFFLVFGTLKFIKFFPAIKIFLGYILVHRKLF